MIEIKDLTKALCKDASLLESECLSTAWSENQLYEIIDNPDYKYVTALENGNLLGVGGVICSSSDAAEIFTVAVSKENRGKGTGCAIISALIDFCIVKGAECIFLEVEEGNIPAISLYEKVGFLPVGVRKGFYRGKNAVIMTKQLKKA